MTPFRKTVLAIVARIPAGRVTSYGAVAAMAGQPRAARGVGWILHRLPPDTEVPWWRVVNRDGGLSTYKLPGGAGPIQRARLEAEGVELDERRQVGDDRFWWDPHAPDPTADDPDPEASGAPPRGCGPHGPHLNLGPLPQ
jgi:methylated-DNA-protein-cysteine methyltransferase related protein